MEKRHLTPPTATVQARWQVSFLQLTSSTVLLTIEIVGNGHKLARGPRTVKLENGALGM